MVTIVEKTAGLAAFVRTVDSGSFSGAGRILGASPSAVSKSVARLEKRLGVRLLQRSTRTLSLTAEGSVYYDFVAPLLQGIESAEDVVQSAGSAKGLLRITVPVLVGRSLVSGWVKEFSERSPNIKLEVTVTDRNVDMIREGYDLAIRIGNLDDTGLIGRHLADIPYLLVASPAYLASRGHPESVADLQDHACLRYLLAGRPYAFIFADGRSYLPDGCFDTDDAVTLIQAAMEGVGIVQLPAFALRTEIERGTLTRVLPNDLMATTSIHALHAFGRQVPMRVRLFIDYLMETSERLL
ncbi:MULTISPECIES: LysR family transcriptional regulator [unclassified Pseudomonas]|uniref:LysR family transcriptional regulator n=1 Tax=unclassified Pseudomonas TaxID=196821 RepID=UPI000D3B5D76|nr:MULTISPECIES: LysR family transcriptional regulator [unclassified Pseudomonas]RAU43816.1 LysR family transcriptional regulator [Pseudomonas sp. RIT 409]RAU56290.1 LysR family transcriptional regulator [Pseudomonas sp. RIT 412]